jgi:hypothetical protein
MTTPIAASLFVSAATSVCADPISSSSSKSAPTSLRGRMPFSSSPSPAPSASPLADGGLFRSRDLQLSPQQMMECYINGNSIGEYQQVDCTTNLLNSCNSIFGCVQSQGMAIAAGSSQCSTWTQWPYDQDGGYSDDQCVYAYSCCTSSS